MKNDDGNDEEAVGGNRIREESSEENEEIGLNDEQEPSEGGYVSESAAPLTRAYREEVEERVAERTRVQTGNETGDPTGNETENGPGVDPNDPNLSETLAEAGAQERKDEMGMVDIEPFLDDAEEGDDESVKGPRG